MCEGSGIGVWDGRSIGHSRSDSEKILKSNSRLVGFGYRFSCSFCSSDFVGINFVAIDNIEPFYCYCRGLHRENFDLGLLTVHGEEHEEGDIDSGFIE